MVENLAQEREDLLYAAPGEGRDVDPPRRGQDLLQARPALLQAPARLGFEQVPLVDRHHRGAAQLPGRAGDGEVAGGHPLRGVDQQQGEVGALDLAPRHHHRQLLRGVVGAAAAADAGGVDQDPAPALALDPRVDRIAGGARAGRDQGPVGADNLVEERGLADVGAPDDGDPGRLALLLGWDRRCREPRRDCPAQVLDPAAMFGRDQHLGLQPEGVELAGAGRCLLHVSLVDHQDGRLAELAQLGPDQLVARHQAVLAVHHEEQEVALLHREEDLAVEAERIVARHQAPGVDQVDAQLGVDLRVAGDAVAGDPGLVVDDRLAPPHQAVEQGGLAHVGAAHDGHGRVLRHVSRAANRSATASVRAGRCRAGRQSTFSRCSTIQRPSTRLNWYLTRLLWPISSESSSWPPIE